jgi:hypothetical protein
MTHYLDSHARRQDRRIVDAIHTMNKLEKQRDSVVEVLCKFVDQYAYERHTWPDDMVALLDEAHGVLSEVMGQERKDT